MKKIFHVLLLAVLVTSLLAGCGIETKKTQEDSKYSLYYLSAAETSLKTEAYTPKEETKEFMVKDLLQKLEDREVPEGRASLLPDNVAIKSYDVQKDLLVIDFSKEYSSMSKAREVLTRAGIVHTLVQIPDIQKVRFTVNGQELTNSRNQKVGDMTEDTFVEYSGKEADAYRYDTFTLYFTDKSGKKLVKETRNVYYRRTLPRERVVLEQLAKGPMEEGHYPTLPETSVAVSVITADRICYVNMNDAFQSEALDVAENIPVYSVVNSILDSCEADRVQISIEGSLEGNYEDNMPLYNFYEKNEDLIVQDKAKKDS